ncbi:hypothetical protein A2303_02605 [Candidatus Falkowbacteria bacterium RIFOXYB2_FULL_47_14]|uniref:O-antigen ligase-related domain-containing protein n=1 Tax=Candidatus Falkowbacteria bacterium RIFOXYA2_FULL_47_19 TaxID=1797994 RepID=A0A1F5SI84_9BACT|nr:MAG: hypothetical protein A2227_05830 [Candidatus Falkowbacteria bacterium RIFOXYA2_FULL_47_19]OGF34532.1 MAG: hypothetical protein A2468_04870 [Candidatus Falkowbacteria bacterium RIFOXYC2_FULL_46_15]OGF43013.1 MAG: hypothetical protein A2303_02605 [Candidatus Falkowbacteria bacterium RIFOXYB2_FULL_47_14]
MTQRTYLNILKFGVYLSLITVFFVFRGLLFPFITSKQISFNILIEIMTIFWIAFIIKYPEYRPKKQWITVGLVAFLAIITLSAITGLDFNLSFWGDVERMLGVFHVLHFLALYLIIITVFREWKDWKMLFIFSVAVALMETNTISKKQGMTYGTIGNTAYVSGYLIFNMYFCLLLLWKERNKYLRWLWLLPLPFFFRGFTIADTSGAYVGLGFSIIFAFFLYGILHHNKKIKAATLTVCILSSVFVAYFFIIQRDSFLTRRSPVFNRIVTDVNLQKNTFQTRLISWRTALKDFPNHPFLGTGFGNFAITFDKHFDPHFYDYTRGETYFDRAHNNVIDIGSTSGLLGLLAYLSIFGAVGFYMIRDRFKAKRLDTHEFVILASLLTAYFVQNLAVFDSLVTYVGLMITLGYIVWLVREREDDSEIDDPVYSRLSAGDYYVLAGLVILGAIIASQDKVSSLAADNMRTLWLFIGVMLVYAIGAAISGKEGRTGDRELDNKEIFAIAGAGFLLLTVIFQFNIKPLKMLLATIDGQRYASQGQYVQTIEAYRRALSYNTVLDRDSRTSFVRIFIGQPEIFRQMGQAEGEEALDFIIAQAEANVKYNPGDSLNQMVLAQILNTAAMYYSDNQDKYAHYADRALAAIDRSIEATPGRTPVYFQKAQFLISRGNKEGALQTLQYAATLNENDYEPYCHLGRTYMYFKEEAEGFKYIDQCIDKKGANMLQPASLVKAFLAHYAEQEDWPRIIKLYEALTGLEPKNTRNWIELAKLYAQTGEKEKAREAVEKVVEIDPASEQYAHDFIDELEKSGN